MSLILDLIFPKKCLNCGSNGQYLCSKCLSTQRYNQPKYINQNSKEGSLSLFHYENIIKKAIFELKYHFVTDIIEELADISATHIKSTFPHLLKYWQDNHFIIVPIPLYITRENWRGFNQSILLGQKIAQNLNLNFCDHTLFRRRHTYTQAKIKNINLRHQNLHQAFYFVTPIPKNIILFDDVASSFSTLNSAYQSLNCADSVRCWYLTLAG